MSIEAMKQAADKLAIGLAYPGMRLYHDDIRAAITALRTAIAEAESVEPVWDASAPIVMTPHPAFAKRQWVGLTDEEVDGLWEMAKLFAPAKHFYLLIEAKLKEKNNG